MFSKIEEYFSNYSMKPILPKHQNWIKTSKEKKLQTRVSNEDKCRNLQ